MGAGLEAFIEVDVEVGLVGFIEDRLVVEQHLQYERRCWRYLERTLQRHRLFEAEDLVWLRVDDDDSRR